MSLRNLKLNIKKGKRPTDPMAIFQGLTLRGAIENIWGPQQSALREWHEKFRAAHDNIVEMNTGGGKTLVGLLIAQSLLNETRGHILYVCPTNQLVEQTIEKAGECGLSVASRYDRAWSNRPQFDGGDAFCVTNYAALFNGQTVFRSTPVDGIVFDDAHVAESIIRSQFTIRIAKSTELFRKILTIYRAHFANSCQASHFEDVSNEEWDSLVFVPMFIAKKHAQELRKLLVVSGIDDSDDNKYPWEHLKNRIDRCCVFLSGGGINITPSVIPLHTMPYFADGVRRVYLTATIPSQASFSRTFGVPKPNIISPRGKSGDAQRLFVFPLADTDEAQKEDVLELIAGRKACVISSSRKRAEEWVPPASIYESKSGHTGIQTFAKAKEASMLALVARYDGVDLPGNACRILILDRLPIGENLFDKFIDQVLQISMLRSSHTAIRITQAIGRIFRSNTDHGVVILRGQELQSWLTTPRNRALLPGILQKQLQLALSLREQVQAGETSYPDLIEGILDGDEGWDDLYRGYIDEYRTDPVLVDATVLPHNLLIGERQAHQHLWDGHYSSAAADFLDLAKEAASLDQRLSAWYFHWAAFSYQQNGADEDAMLHFHRAGSIRSELGCPSTERDKLFAAKEETKPSVQSTKMAQLYRAKRQRVRSMLSEIMNDLAYGDATGRAEEAMKNLGTLVGLDSSRPEKDDKNKTGPDVLWMGSETYDGASFELKTNKKADGEYSKDDIKDCHDHCAWLHSKHPGKTFIQAIIGRKLSVSQRANPHEELRIITVEAVRDLASRVTSLYEQVDLSGNSEAHEFERWLRYFSLLWPSCVDALPCRLATDIKNREGVESQFFR